MKFLIIEMILAVVTIVCIVNSTEHMKSEITDSVTRKLYGDTMPCVMTGDFEK